MPRNSLIDKYAKEIGKDSDIVHDAIVCFFNYVKKSMKLPSLPDIRLKGFGVFRPALSRLKQQLRGLEKKKDFMDFDVYSKKKKYITKYLNDHEFKK